MPDRSKHLLDALKMIVDLSAALREAAPIVRSQDSSAAARYDALLDRVRLTVDRGEPYEPEDPSAWPQTEG